MMRSISGGVEVRRKGFYGGVWKVVIFFGGDLIRRRVFF
jgi:hypothetical protein